MSYIRATLCPEGLYIINKECSTVEIHWSIDKPLSSGCHRTMVLPQKTFNKAANVWYHNGDNAIDIKGFRIEEQYVFLKTGRKVPANYNPFKDKRRAVFLIRVSYKNDFVYLWRVTWQYVVNNVVNNVTSR